MQVQWVLFNIHNFKGCLNNQITICTDLLCTCCDFSEDGICHFFNPAPVMKLIEVIRGENTTDEVNDKVIAISKEIGKTPVEVNEAPGFVVNRIYNRRNQHLSSVRACLHVPSS